MLATRQKLSSLPIKTEPEWLGPGRFAAVLGLLIVVSFPLVLFGLEAFAYGDSAQFAYPVAFYHRQRFWDGQVPLWNPLSSCGTPFLAQWNTMTLYPLSLCYLVLPLPWSFGVFCLGHFFIGGLGMYCLARRWTGGSLPAAVAGVVYGFNGFTWYALMWPHLLAGMAWMPWVVLAMELAWREGRGYIALAAVTAGIQLLSGGAEAVLQTWLLLGVLGLGQLWRGEVPRGRLVLRALASGGLAVGLAAAQLLPFLDLLQYSQRSGAYGSGGMAWIAPLPLTGWMNYLVPLFHCVKNSNGVFVQAGQSFVGSYYLGVGTVALVSLAAWQVRQRRVWLLLGFVVFSVLMALGPRAGLYDVLKRVVPLFGFVRFQVKFLVLATFALPLLAAFGLNWHLGRPEDEPVRGWRSLGAVALGLLGLMAFIAWYDWRNPIPGAALTTTLLNAGSRTLFLGLVLGCLAGLRLRGDQRLQGVFQVALLLVLWFDVFTHSSDLSPTVPTASWQPGAVRQYLQWDPQPGAAMARAFQSKASVERMLSTGLPNLQQDLVGRRLSLFMNLNLLEGIPKFDGFWAVDLRDYFDVFKHVYFTTNEAAGLKDFLSLSLVSSRTNIMDWTARSSALPLVTAGQQPIFAQAPETLDALLQPSFEPLRQVYLPPETREQVSALAATSARVGPVQFAPGRLQFEVEADAPTLVTVAQSFHHWWQAQVDGKPVPLWRANYAFQALQVPAAKHVVVLDYKDKAFAWGVGISLLSVLACGATWGYWRKVNPTAFGSGR